MDKMEMDKDMVEEMTKKLTDLGIDKEMIDEKLMWVVKKTSMKIMKFRLILDEKGVTEDKTKEIVKKIVDKAFDKDLNKIREWHKEHEERHHKDCC